MNNHIFINSTDSKPDFSKQYNNRRVNEGKK